MRRVLITLMLLMVPGFTSATTFVCLDALNRGIAFDDVSKTAWQIYQDSRPNIEIQIIPEKFMVYRCPGCYSFEGVIDVNGRVSKVMASTRYDASENQMWMKYSQLGVPEESYGLMLRCSRK